MNQDTIPPYLIEQLKLMADYIKFISTLSTGSIVLLTIFIEKLSIKERWKSLVIFALGGFTLSLVASVIAFTGLLFPLPNVGNLQELEYGNKVWSVGLFVTWFGFLVGIISLTAFAIGNIRQPAVPKQ